MLFLKDNSAIVSKNLKSSWISKRGKEDIAWAKSRAMTLKWDAFNIKYTFSEYAGGNTLPVWRIFSL